MAELVLPGVFVEVRAEGLMLPQGVTVGNLGVVGTASKGPIGQPVILGSYAEAKETFGDYDPWNDESGGKLTLVRALELAFRHGATTLIAVRVAKKATDNPDKEWEATAAKLDLKSGDQPCLRLEARWAGTWGNELEARVDPAEEDAFVEGETVEVDDSTWKLQHAPALPSARNRIVVESAGGGLPQTLQIRDPKDISKEKPLVPGQVLLDSDGKLDFGKEPATEDVVRADYSVDAKKAKKVTLRYRGAEEVYTVVGKEDLARGLAKSAWVTGKVLEGDGESLEKAPLQSLTGGTNGAVGADYQGGLDKLLDQPVHIVVAAGQDQSFGDELASHCRVASSDEVQRERVAVVGSGPGVEIGDLLKHQQASDRLLFVAPGIQAIDAAASPPREVTLPGSYAAAAVAGRMAATSPHVSLTNKVLPVGGLETVFSRAELKQLVLARILVLEERQGYRIVKGITTSTNPAWHQVTTRRIVDYTKLGVRAAANPYIGRLNNTRVRGALRTAINSFLADMVTDEMLVGYELEVTATREQEIRGIVQVTLLLLPVFSIDYIKVTLNLG